MLGFKLIQVSNMEHVWLPKEINGPSARVIRNWLL